MLSVWHIWILVGIALFIGEIFTPGFLLACLGLACLASAAVAWLGFGLKVQLTAFIAGTLAAFFGVRPFFLRHCYRESSAVRTNVDALIGKTGRVIEPIDNRVGSGRVLVGGDDWKAVSVDGVFIDEGTAIEVVKLEGTRLYVRSI
jgi:membrane protein implicated in regulation of membrane protease activity